MFDDPISSNILHLKDKGYAQMHYGIAHVCFKSKLYFLLLYHLFKAVIYDKSMFKYILKKIRSIYF